MGRVLVIRQAFLHLSHLSLHLAEERLGVGKLATLVVNSNCHCRFEGVVGDKGGFSI